jgi:hypothetical protein
MKRKKEDDYRMSPFSSHLWWNREKAAIFSFAKANEPASNVLHGSLYHFLPI